VQQQPAELGTVPVPVGGILERGGRPDLLRREAGDAQRGTLTKAGSGGGALPPDRSSGAGLLRLDFDAIRAGCATSSVGSGGVRRAMEASDFDYHSGEPSGGRCARPPRMASMVMPSFAA
jgi:hypothetical protein